MLRPKGAVQATGTAGGYDFSGEKMQVIKNTRFYEKVYLLIFILLELSVFPIVFMRHESIHSVLYYAAIFLCFITSLVLLRFCKGSVFTSIAFFFTVIADFFLILLGTGKLVAMCAFTLTQIFYCFRTLSIAASKKERICNVTVRLIASAIATIAVFVVLKEGAEPLFVISLIYYVNLLTNIAFAFLHFRKHPFFAIGLLLFAFCDALIGLSFVEDIFALPEGNFIDVLWSLPVHLESMFYQPSQVLLALSVLSAREK